ncbi:MAG: hypothetical protein ACRD1S_03520, partial [Vicinamibacterales bacterium]
RLRLDAEGRLVYFDGVPRQVPDEGKPGLAPGASAPASGDSWTLLFQEAGLDQTTFTPTLESWTPPHYADARAAWTGAIGPRTEMVRVEAASHRGRPVYFAIVGPWTRPTRQQPAPGADRWLGYVSLLLLSGSLIAAALMARHNLKAGRGDRSGAIRLAAFLFAIQTTEFLLSAHHMAHLGVEWTQFSRGASISFFIAGMIWLLYLALEPVARRLWPNLLIAWSRLLTGRLRDPMLGRDLLIGLVAGLAVVLMLRLQYFLPMLIGRPPADLDSVRLDTLVGPRHALSGVVTQVDDAVLTALVILMLLVGSRLALRRVWLAFAASTAILSLLFLSGFSSIDLFAVTGALTGAGLMMFVLLRYGLLAEAAMIFAMNLSASYPFTLTPRAWYFDAALVGFVTFAVLIFWGFRLSQGRAQPA